MSSPPETFNPDDWSYKMPISDSKCQRESSLSRYLDQVLTTGGTFSYEGILNCQNFVLNTKFGCLGEPDSWISYVQAPLLLKWLEFFILFFTGKRNALISASMSKENLVTSGKQRNPSYLWQCWYLRLNAILLLEWKSMVPVILFNCSLFVLLITTVKWEVSTQLYGAPSQGTCLSESSSSSAVAFS